MYPARDGTSFPALSTVAVTNLMSLATPFASVDAAPAAPPSASRRVTVAPATAFVSAVRVMSTVRIRVNIPLPVTSTESTSMVPSTKSTRELPVITTSSTLFMVMSVRVISAEPADSIPTALEEIVIPVIETGLSVLVPYLNAAPALFVTLPVKSPERSLA